MGLAVPEILRLDRSIPAYVRDWTPRSRLGWSILRALPHLPRDLALELIDRISSVAVIETELRIRVLRSNGLFLAGLVSATDAPIEDHGIVSRRVVTDAGVAFLVDAFENLTEPETEKFHAIGTGVTAEAVGQTALVTELTTEYSPDNTRATGSLAEAAANIFQSVGVNTLDSGTPAIREHALMSQAAAGGGTMLDRSLFAAINLDGTRGDGMQTDYRFTITAGG